MSRATLERRRDAEAHWPALLKFLGEVQDLRGGEQELFTASAIEQTACQWDLDGRKALVREWWSLNNERGWKEDIDALLNDGFGIDRDFASAGDSRRFMSMVYDALIISVRAEAGIDWRP
jgi:hypothetical protein